MPLGHHPLQRAGARACAVLTGRESPQQMTIDDVEIAAEYLVDVLTQTACADRQSRRYELWKALLALFPNSPATHARRPREPHVPYASGGVAAMSGLPQLVGEELSLGLQCQLGEAGIEGDVDIGAAATSLGPLFHPSPRDVGSHAP